MKTYATYFQNDPRQPLRYGEVELIDPPRQRLRGEPAKTGVEALPVFCGFCGTDYELMNMGGARDGAVSAYAEIAAITYTQNDAGDAVEIAYTVKTLDDMLASADIYREGTLNEEQIRASYD